MRGEKLSGWRRVAGAVWGEPDDPQIYGMLAVDATAALAFLSRARAAGARLTPTDLVARAVAVALREVPEVDVRLVGDRAVRRPSVDVFVITAVAGGRDLSGVKIVGADRRSAIELAAELAERAHGLKGGRDPGFARSKHVMDTLPRPLLRAALRLVAYVAGERALGIPALGLPPSPFGSAMVSSVGSIGLPLGFVPLSWLYRVPLLVVAGEIEDRPVAIAGQVEIRPILPISATIDHRWADGAHVARLLRPFRAYLEAPERFEPGLA